MKVLFIVLSLISVTILGGCLNQGTKMVLLDEEIVKIEFSPSKGVGSINGDVSVSFEDSHSIKVLEQVIKHSVEKKVDVHKAPDYDLVVSYGDQLPMHAIHLWLGNEGEESILMYMVGEGETFKTTTTATKQLRELIVQNQ